MASSREPYLWSPTSGKPREANCTRIWWFLPVWSRIRTNAGSVSVSRAYSSRADLTPLRSRFTTKTLFFWLSFHKRSCQSPAWGGVPCTSATYSLTSDPSWIIRENWAADAFVRAYTITPPTFLSSRCRGKISPPKMSRRALGTSCSESRPTGFTQTAIARSEYRISMVSAPFHKYNRYFSKVHRYRKLSFMLVSTPKYVILSERSESKNLRITAVLSSNLVRRSFDSTSFRSG